MKKKLLLLFMALTTMGGVNCWADTYYTTADSDGNSFAFESTDGTTATITWVYLGGSATNLTIPTTVWSNADPYPSFTVTAIGAGTYAINNAATAITSLTIAEGVTTINDLAFNGWTGLTSISFPSSLASIGNYAFGTLNSLTSLTFASTTPPTLGTETLKYSNEPYYWTNCIITVPDGSASVYGTNDYLWAFGQIAYYYPTHFVEAGSFTIGTTGWGTYYNNYGYKLPEGVEGYIITSTSGNTAYPVKIYEAGDEVYAGLALLVKSKTELAEPKTFNFSVLASGGNTASWPVDVESQAYTTLLNGTQTAGETTYWGSSSSDYYYYKLAKDDTNGLGWYWGAAEGAAFTNGAHKAYLIISKTAAARSFISMFDNETTGVADVRNKIEEESGTYYDLSGRRVAQPAKGLYIVNGKKVVIK